jgi:SSS family solute:Na+ symporter
MQTIDWLIVLLPVIGVFLITRVTASRSRTVAGFLSAERCAGRYLICNARGEAGNGAISAVAVFQLVYASGLTLNWWSQLAVTASLFVALTGFVIYRYRETRALTLAQFFEIRYSKAFRIFTGFIAFLSGVVNYGIFPGVSAKFLVYLCGWPEVITVFGWTIPTYVPLMAAGLTYALYLTLSGGQITIMITDCAMGIFSGLLYLVICIFLINFFRWDQIAGALANQPAGHSLLNPFDSSAIKDFNVWYVLIGIFLTVYGTMAWQGGHAYNSSAITPHEAKMAGILGNWRNMTIALFLLLLGISAYTFLNHPDFASGAGRVSEKLAGIADPQTRDQMRVPLALAEMMPTVLRGMLCAVMLFAWIAVDSSYLHSWGSILVQDVVLPFRKTPFPVKSHIALLRGAIIGVAVFGFLFSLLFSQTEYIYMYFAITGAIYIGGAGAAIIGGLYWSKGTTAGAWTGLLVGSSLSVGSIILKQVRPDFPVNGQLLALFATLCAAGSYVVVSLLTSRQKFNMDRMLHRGAYSLAGEHQAPPDGLRSRLAGLIGISREFTRADRWTSITLFCYSAFFLMVFFVITAWNFISPWPTSWWSAYWHVAAILLPLVIGVVTTLWISIGGLTDMKAFFKELHSRRGNALDDGTVVHHQNLDEAVKQSDVKT